MGWITRFGITFLLLSGFLGTACARTTSEEKSPVPSFPQQIPKELIQGEALFNSYCARCHGERATGTNLGPPFVHKIYEPSHHADLSFHFAVQRGVRAHHWSFGDMPPVPGVKQEEVVAIVSYVRWLQQQVGIE